ncbi:MAG TPA: alpha/beta hydrolase domain-containing protein [Acidimicrobiales bacterium]|nr:alpha/beta hydrolase domain-containing protein [Acidimicrobiales bacterium]
MDGPRGEQADLSDALTAGNGVFLGSFATADLAGGGYVESEHLASGTACSYRADGALGADGRWDLVEDQHAPYRTRVVVRRPASPEDFSGTVIVEWLNVSSGYDADVVWSNTHEELMRRGHAWVGVSAQLIGAMGGPILTPFEGMPTESPGLCGIDPARYASLDHPGDGFAFDMFTQVARAVRGGAELMGGLVAERLIAAGQSQSAYALVAYLDGVQPRTRAFDGFFVHSRGKVAMSLAPPGRAVNPAEERDGPATIIRTDTDVPVLELQTEGDLDQVLMSLEARQPDSLTFRLWEVAGTSHADAHTLGPFADAIDAGVPMNRAPMHLVVKAAMHALEKWVRTGQAPPTAPLIEVNDAVPPQIVRDDDGIAKGGIRLPVVEVPVEVLSGIPGPKEAILFALFGSTLPLREGRLAELYTSREDYLARYTRAAGAVIDGGFVLEADRDVLLAEARPEGIPA